MASAPEPGSRAAEVNARKFMRLRIKDRTLDFVPTLETREKFAVRSASGLPFEAFFTGEEHAFGEDSFRVLWWLALRQNGHPTMPFAKADAQFTALFED